MTSEWVLGVKSKERGGKKKKTKKEKTKEKTKNKLIPDLVKQEAIIFLTL